ncbi:MAG: hypothetical protein GX811_01270 [Lentisphaerae bacterium]|nr:hypothetical protein [Lentisphaerota bacterium]
MKEEGQNWFNDLREFITDCRKKKPINDWDNLSVEADSQSRIIGGCFVDWLEKHGPSLLKERAFLAKLNNWEKDPFIVFTSDEPGLVVASEILEEGSDSIACLYPDEFTFWLKKHPDPEYRWHIHTWSYFLPLDKETKKKTKTFPLAAGESYLLHREGTMCGELFGRGYDHLWKWNGEELVLLEESINQWVS